MMSIEIYAKLNLSSISISKSGRVIIFPLISFSWAKQVLQMETMLHFREKIRKKKTILLALIRSVNVLIRKTLWNISRFPFIIMQLFGDSLIYCCMHQAARLIENRSKRRSNSEKKCVSILKQAKQNVFVGYGLWSYWRIWKN